MTLEDMEKLKAEAAVKEVDAEFTDDDFEAATMADDITKSIKLLKQAHILYDYLSDPALCIKVSKQERDAMARLSTKIVNFLDEIEPYYEEYVDSEDED